MCWHSRSSIPDIWISTYSPRCDIRIYQRNGGASESNPFGALTAINNNNSSTGSQSSTSLHARRPTHPHPTEVDQGFRSRRQPLGNTLHRSVQVSAQRSPHCAEMHVHCIHNQHIRTHLSMHVTQSPAPSPSTPYLSTTHHLNAPHGYSNRMFPSPHLLANTNMHITTNHLFGEQK